MLTSDKSYEPKGSSSMLYVDYTNLPKVVKPGSLIFVDDGLISLRVKETGQRILIYFLI